MGGCGHANVPDIRRYALEKVVKLNLKSITLTETIKGHPLASVVKDQKPIPLETLAKALM